MVILSLEMGRPHVEGPSNIPEHIFSTHTGHFRKSWKKFIFGHFGPPKHIRKICQNEKKSKKSETPKMVEN